MKKLLSIVLIAVLCLGLVACGNSAQPAASGSASTGTTTPAATNAPASTATEPAPTGSEPAAPAELPEIWTKGKTVNIIVPARAGGGSDMIARYVQAGLQELYPDVNFVVTNYDTPEVGMQEAKRAKADGLTLLIGSCTNMDNYLSGTSEVNPNEDLAVVGKFTDGGAQAWIATADAPYGNMVELAAYIKEHPMELTAGVQLGGTSHIIWYSCLQELGVADLVNYVQCGNEADKLTNIASNSIDIANCSIGNSEGYRADGRLKVLGIVGPAIATRDYTAEYIGIELDDSYLSMPEQGLTVTWEAGSYVLLPAGASQEVLEKVNEYIYALKDNDTFLNGMKAMGSMGTPKILADTQADWAYEWDFQKQVTTAMGLNVRG